MKVCDYLNCNEILISRSCKFIPLLYASSDNQKSEKKIQLVATLIKNLETSFGYTLSEEFISNLLTTDNQSIEDTYYTLYNILSKLLPTVIPRPFYTNFPEEVMQLSEAELYMNSVVHYIGSIIGIRVLPEDKKETRTPLFEEVEYKVISLGDLTDVQSIATNIMTSSTSISKKDREDLIKILDVENIDVPIPETFNHKENMIYSLYYLYELSRIDLIGMSNFLKTPTDVLRLAAAFSNGDVSLSEKNEFRGIKRKNRKFIISLLENMVSKFSIESEMKNHRKEWLRLGRAIHIGDYYKKYPEVSRTFDVLRNNEKDIKTESSKIEFLFKEKNIKELVEFYKTRPGKFARNLFSLLEMGIEENFILDSFEKVISKVSTPVLLQIVGKIKGLNDDYRMFLPKGDLCKAYVTPNTKNYETIVSKDLGIDLVEMINNELITRFKQLDSLGNVFLDYDLCNFTIPMSNRSTSDSLYKIPRFSKLNFNPDKNFIRLFIYWQDESIENTTDIDLSVSFFDKDWNYIAHISYTNLKSEKLKAYHSGDITSAPAPEGASEFIDLDLSHLKSKEVRYIIPSVHSYTGNYFSNLCSCAFGWMERKNLNSGEIYEPTTVKNLVNITIPGTLLMPMILDLNKEEIIWCEFALTHKIWSQLFNGRLSQRFGINQNGNNIESNIYGLKALGIGATETRTRPDLYYLLYLHLKARGNRVYDRREANIIFDKNTIPFMLDEIVNNYLK